jgi:hypothetical protein
MRPLDNPVISIKPSPYRRYLTVSIGGNLRTFRVLARSAEVGDTTPDTITVARTLDNPIAAIKSPPDPRHVAIAISCELWTISLFTCGTEIDDITPRILVIASTLNDAPIGDLTL